MPPPILAIALAPRPPPPMIATEGALVYPVPTAVTKIADTTEAKLAVAAAPVPVVSPAELVKTTVGTEV